MRVLFVADLWQTTVFLTPQKEFTQKTAGVKDKNIASTTIQGFFFSLTKNWIVFFLFVFSFLIFLIVKIQENEISLRQFSTEYMASSLDSEHISENI